MATVLPPADRLLPAIGLRLLSVALFACMNACIKLGQSRGAAIGELLFFRQAGAAVLVTGVIVAGPGLATIRTARIGAHISRAAVGVTSMALTFAALAMFLQAIATNKLSGWGFTVLYLIASLALDRLGWSDAAYRYGRYPAEAGAIHPFGWSFVALLLLLAANRLGLRKAPA